jgi:predicted PilT family ATPase
VATEFAGASGIFDIYLKTFRHIKASFIHSLYPAEVPTLHLKTVMFSTAKIGKYHLKTCCNLLMAAK